MPPYAARLSPDLESKRTCVILHSSGSTGFPKPVFITHYGLIANIAMSIPETGFSALPLFHGFGHFSMYVSPPCPQLSWILARCPDHAESSSSFRCIYNGKAFTLMPPNLPLTSANICKVIRSSPTRPVQHFAVPYVLKLLAETKEGTETLASFEAVSFAGASVPVSVNRLPELADLSRMISEIALWPLASPSYQSTEQPVCPPHLPLDSR